MIEKIEKKFIRSIFKSIDCLSYSLVNVSTEFLISPYAKFLFDKIKNFYYSYGTLPNKLAVKEWISFLNDKKFAEETLLYVESLKLEDIELDKFEYYCDFIIRNYKFNRFLEILNKSITNLTIENVDKQIEYIQSSVSNIFYTSNKNFDVYDITDNFIERINLFYAKEDKQNIILTPINKLNYALGGGLRPGQLNVIAGVAGSGKSMFLLNFSEFAYRCNKNVVYVTIEMSYLDCINRYHSLISNIDFNKILNNELSLEEKKQLYISILKHEVIDEDHKIIDDFFKRDPMEIGLLPTVSEIENYKENAEIVASKRLIDNLKSLSLRKRENKFLIIDSPLGVSLNTLKAHLRNISSKIKIDLLTVDYLNIMNSGIKGLKDWEDSKYVSRGLKEISREFNVAVLTAAQLHYSDGSYKVTQDDIRYSKAINENADNIIAFRRSEEDETLGIIKLELIKQRYAKTEVIPIREEFSKIRIHEV